MPESAIASGCIDIILSPEEIARPAFVRVGVQSFAAVRGKVKFGGREIIRATRIAARRERSCK